MYWQIWMEQWNAGKWPDEADLDGMVKNHIESEWDPKWEE